MFLRRRATVRAAGVLCAAVLTTMAGAAVSQAGERQPDDYRTPPLPETFGDSLWWYDAMRLAKAHRETTGEGATVAVIDDFIDPSVPELRGQDVRLRTTCLGTRVRPVHGVPYADHGTSMVSLIAGSGRGDAPGGRGIPGIAPDARVLFYSVDPRARTRYWECNDSEIASSIRAAVRAGADVISISLGLGPDAKVERAVKAASEAGVVVVAAAGDTSDPGNTFPAWHPGVVSVGAVDQYAQLWERSPVDGYTDIAAPGVWVSAGNVKPSGEWTSQSAVSGTSPATAITAGALALVKSKYPDATGGQLVQHLIHTPGGDGYDWQTGYGFGIVSVANMLKSSPTQWPDENPLLLDGVSAYERYPMWMSSRIPDPPGRSAESVTRGGGSGAGRAGGKEATSSATGDPRDEQTAGGALQGGGPPAWALPLVIVVVGGAVVGTLVAVRGRRRSRGTERTSTQGV